MFVLITIEAKKRDEDGVSRARVETGVREESNFTRGIFS